MVSYDRILVPVDGSDASKRANAHALAIARRTGATVDFLHVVEHRGVLRSSGADTGPETGRERGESILATAGRLADDADIDVTTELAEGRPADVLLTHAAERGSGLVVMGRSGASGVGESLLGGVTDKVVRAGELPVLVVPRGNRAKPESTSYDRILLPTDGSEPAEAAAPHAAVLADRFGATVHVVSAVDVQRAGGLFDAGGVPEEYVENLEADAGRDVDAMVERLADYDDIPVETAVVRGTPHEALGDYASAEDVDLVVMGAHGRSGVKRWVLGSVTDRLLRSVDVPLLLVPAVE